MAHTLKATRRSATAALLTLILCASLPGCAPQKTSSLDDALTEYDRRQYNSALVKARHVMDSSIGDTRDRARYIAGMSAYQLNKDAEAMTLLSPLRFNANPDIAGPANATLGLIYKQRAQHPQAETHLLRATEKLHGNDRAQAHYHLGAVYQKMGRWAEAQRHLRLAAGMATSSSLRLAAQQQLDTAGYTLQLGAYSQRSNADDRARELRATCERAGLGAPRVLPSKVPNGSTLYLVHAGRFSSFDSANAARTRLGRTDVAVTTIKTDY